VAPVVLVAWVATAAGAEEALVAAEVLGVLVVWGVVRVDLEVQVYSDGLVFLL
jgi:hypothetical protein